MSNDENEKSKLRVEYVFTLRAVLRELSMVNRKPANLAVAEEIEQALNQLLVGGEGSGGQREAA